MSEVGTSGWTFPSHLNTDSYFEADTHDESFSGWHGGGQSITHSTWTALEINWERWDPEGIHNQSTYTTRISIPSDGDYLITGYVYEQTGKQDWRVTATQVVVDGSVVIASCQRHVATGWPSGHLPFLVFSVIVSGNEAEYYEVEYYQRNTSNQSRTADIGIDMVRIGGKAEEGSPA